MRYLASVITHQVRLKVFGRQCDRYGGCAFTQMNITGSHLGTMLHQVDRADERRLAMVVPADEHVDLTEGDVAGVSQALEVDNPDAGYLHPIVPAEQIHRPC